jgi:hypothetical protein
MRLIPSVIRNRIEKLYQTRHENADPYMDVIIARPKTALQDEGFLERQLITTGTDISRTSIAVRRTNIFKDPDYVYIAYIDNGVGYIARAKTNITIKEIEWVALDTITESNPLTDIDICFDGRTFITLRNFTQFQTEDDPWIFWVEGGKLWGAKLGEVPLTELVSANVEAISAVRGVYSELADQDQGLILFFIQAGNILYKQYINGEWGDAIVVPAGVLPEGKTWIDLSAFRTWDYRVGFQAKASDGTVVEVFTFNVGIARRNLERIEIRQVKADAELISLEFKQGYEEENIEITEVTGTGALLYSNPPVPIRVENIPMDDPYIYGEEDWGRLLEVEFDIEVFDLTSNANNFKIIDGNYVEYTAQDIYYSVDNKTIILEFVNFNQAEGTDCILEYTQGTISQAIGVLLENFSFEFTPINLDPGEPPAVLEVYNE